jgi:hypothetical protein
VAVDDQSTGNAAGHAHIVANRRAASAL